MARKRLLFLALMMALAIMSGCATAPTQREVLGVATGYKPVIITTEQKAVVATTVHQAVGCSGGGLKYFDSASECSDAMASGECSYYTPSYFGNRLNDPINGSTTVRVPLEKEACIRMNVVGAIYYWVPQRKGSNFRFRKKADGTLEEIPYARDDCGNKVTGIVYPSPQQSVVVQQIAPPAAIIAVPPAQKNVCAEKGLYGEQYSTGYTQDGGLECFETIPWYAWENLKTPVAYVTGAVVVVGAVVFYCASTGRCGFWKKSKPAPPPPPPPPPTWPVGS
ncbi:MAG: hypothetical protein HY228_01995, partial [Candidatus Yonathbacteria bacterium]|nr:hypothetical protein [Candidatus Yonathbacteria bacterium]